MKTLRELSGCKTRNTKINLIEIIHDLGGSEQFGFFFVTLNSLIA